MATASRRRLAKSVQRVRACSDGERSTRSTERVVSNPWHVGGPSGKGMPADSEVGVGLTCSARSPYNRAAEPIAARRCTQHQCEISGWTQAADGGARASL